jgi:phosphopantetheinyl transferase
LLLDNSSQLVLFHLYEQSENVTALLPFHIDSIDFFCPPESHPELVTVQAQLLSLTDKGTEARLEIAGGGRALIRINNITSKRVMLSDHLKAFVANPQNVYLSKSRNELANKIADAWSVMFMSGSSLPNDATTLEWLTDYVLTRSEYEYFSQDSKLEKRKREWLAGRLAVKDAAREFVTRQLGISLCPGDIEITYDEAGKPIVNIAAHPEINLVASIAHAEGDAIAIVGLADHNSGCGIDIEPCRNRGNDFLSMAFTQAEHELFAGKEDLEKWEIVTQLWCAKEALSKAIGQGLSGAPKTFEISHLDSAGLAKVKTGNLEPTDVFIFVEDDVVIALTSLKATIAIR